MKRGAILCVQVQHFYARVATLRSGGELAGKLVGVTRGSLVLDASPEAAAVGLRAGMRLRQARRWFPQVSFVPAVDEEYPEYARPVLDICASYTPLVDPETPARAFLDVSGCEALYGSPEAVAGLLARRIPAETGFACVVGGGRNRLVAHLAASQQRMVPPGEEREFLGPLSLRLLGDALKPDLAEWLELRSVSTFADVLRLPAGMLWRSFGVEGEKLARLAMGEDPSPVRAAYPPRTIEARIDCEVSETLDQMCAYLGELANGVAGRLGETRESARRYRLSLSFREGGSASQALLLPAPICDRHAIHDVLLRLFRGLDPSAPPIAAAATADEITPGEAFQASLFPELADAAGPGYRTPEARERDRRLAHTLRLLALRHGPTAVISGHHLRQTRRPRLIEIFDF